MKVQRVDELLTGPAVVYGSPPPDGRDLDLLLEEGNAAKVRAALVEEGWCARRQTVAVFGGCTAFAVDLVDISAWAPSEAVARAVQEQSLPLPGFIWLRVPADHHRLLILARRYRDGMALDDKKLRTLAAFDAAVWGAARAEADSWGLRDWLERLHGGSAAAPSKGRATDWSAARRGLASARRRPRVIALSGLDGAGKSTHAEHLRTALEALGYDVSIQWTKIARDRWLKILVAPIRGVVNLLLSGRGGVASGTTVAGNEHVDADGESRNYPDGAPPPPDPAKLLRQQSPLVTTIWAFVVAFANATTHRREVNRRRTRVVICDRYVLDSAAHLRYRYGFDRSFAWQSRVVRALSPRPAAAFFLDVSPATARARKPEQYTTSDLTRLRQCYTDAAARLPVTIVDVEQPMEEVAADVARRAWLALGG